MNKDYLDAHFTFGDVLRHLFWAKWFIATWALIGVITSLVYIQITPKIYNSKVTLEVPRLPDFKELSSGSTYYEALIDRLKFQSSSQKVMDIINKKNNLDLNIAKISETLNTSMLLKNKPFIIITSEAETPTAAKEALAVISEATVVFLNEHTQEKLRIIKDENSLVDPRKNISFDRRDGASYELRNYEVKIVDGPNLITKITSPNRNAILALGLALGILLGATIGLVKRLQLRPK